MSSDTQQFLICCFHIILISGVSGVWPGGGGGGGPASGVTSYMYVARRPQCDDLFLGPRRGRGAVSPLPHYIC